jgi:hypothetical protein
MRKILTAALAALTIGGAVTATATTADAAPFGGGHFGGRGGFNHGYGRGYGPGLAVGAGLLGLAVGASLAHPAYGYDYGYAPGYYGGPAYAYDAPCRVHYRWDPYAGRSVPVERCY